MDHTDDGLAAAIKALDEVVAPAIDTANPLAVEQLRLVSRFLGFLRTRMPQEHARAHHELRHYLALAGELVPLAPVGAAVPVRQQLTQAVAAATPIAADPLATAPQLQQSIEALSASISTLVRHVAAAPEAVRAPVERTVVRASRSLLDAQRAWFLPMGFEPDLARVPALADALAQPR